ncbi:MAG: UDP-glucose/GDP-mannose dehydrogenase family protein [Candidatus Hydrothermarchaeota archaeon]|nr:UDP-glucose/GDP-mannose dehydrogenase family protein [Candidatus Hydrothermarchaeota archaeon]
MKISIVGTGYVGLVTGACFAELGHSVVCMDVNEERVKKINAGIPPIYEENLEDMLERSINVGRIRATVDVREAVMDSEVSFISVGTPSGLLDYIDLKYIDEVSKGIGEVMKEKKDYHLVVVKSTVVPGTTEHSVLPLLEKHSGKKAGDDFGLAMNPEFLREGKAIEDFMKPDRIVIGGIDERSTVVLEELYKAFDCPIMKTNPRTAEMIKYSTNSFLVTKISFINEIGNICKQLGINVYEVAKGLGMDSRVSPKFLNAGLGFGGSCFPKDVKALVGKAKEVYYRPIILNAALELNETQPLRMVELLEIKMNSLTNMDVVVLGLAFKPGTDDMREAPAIKIIQNLLKRGARVHAADPEAVDEANKIFAVHEDLHLYRSAKEAVKHGKYVLIVTEWDEFRRENLYRGKVVIDGRRIEEARAAKEYEGVCW